MPLCCKIISQPHSTLCENFRSCETTPWHTSAISQPSTLISQLQNGCEIPKAWKLQFSQPKPHFAGCFIAAKHPFGTRLPFRSTPPPISQLRKCPFAAKLALRYEIGPPLRKLKRPLASIFFNGINSKFLINRSFELQTGAREEPNQSNLLSSPSHLSLSRAHLCPSPLS